jgi:hypothetical protein
VNSHDFPAYMRVTTGLGATGTPASPPIGRARAVTDVGPVVPGSGAGGWNGTAEEIRRSRPGSERGTSPRRSVRDVMDRDVMDRDVMDRGVMDRGEIDRDEVDRDSIHRDEVDRRHALRYEVDQDDADRYRGSRQWSDREQFAAERGNDGPGVPPRNLRGSAPVSLRRPRERRPAARPDVHAETDPAREPLTPLLPVGEDPTPLFTATEYVAVGDSPLFQFVAEFIAIGDDLLGRDVGRIIAADARAHRQPAEPMVSGRRSADPLLDQPRPSAVPAPVAVLPVATPVAVAPIVRRVPAVRSAPVEAMTDADFPGGRHRDGWRVAGHRSAIDSGRRSAVRGPRHRAA